MRVLHGSGVQYWSEPAFAALLQLRDLCSVPAKLELCGDGDVEVAAAATSSGSQAPVSSAAISQKGKSSAKPG